MVWLVGNTLSLLIMVLAWVAASGDGSYGGYSKSELITYYILSLLLQWSTGWFPYYQVKESIKNGSIVGGILLKPLSLFWKSFAEEVGWRVYSLILGAISTIIFAFAFRHYFSVALDFERFLIVMVSLPLAILVTFTFSLCMGIVAFWFTEIETLDALFWVGRGFLGGQAIPISFVPALFTSLIIFSPFRYMFSFPLEVYFGKLTSLEILSGFLIGIVWVGILAGIYKLMWEKGRQAYTSFGN